MALIDVVERYLARIDRLGTIQEPFASDITMVLRCSGTHAIGKQPRCRVKLRQLQTVWEIAHPSLLLAGEIFVSTAIAPKPLHEFETVKRQAIKAASDTADAYIQSWVRWVIGLEEMYRGRMNEARASADELTQVGRLLNDPRSTGFGLGLLAFVALVSESYAEALEHCEQVLSVAVAPWDRDAATLCKGCALVLLRQTEEGAKLLEGHRSRSVTYGYLYTLVAQRPVYWALQSLSR